MVRIGLSCLRYQTFRTRSVAQLYSVSREVEDLQGGDLTSAARIQAGGRVIPKQGSDSFAHSLRIKVKSHGVDTENLIQGDGRVGP
jgi:hypothetical protein